MLHKKTKEKNRETPRPLYLLAGGLDSFLGYRAPNRLCFFSSSALQTFTIETFTFTLADLQGLDVIAIILKAAGFRRDKEMLEGPC